MNRNVGHGSVNGISSVLHLGTAPHSLINKGMFNQAQVERKGLQIGLPPEPGWYRRVMAVPLSSMVMVFFWSPVTVCDRRNSRLSSHVRSRRAMNDGCLMSHAKVTAREQKHNVQLSVEHLPVTSNSYNR